MIKTDTTDVGAFVLQVTQELATLTVSVRTSSSHSTLAIPFATCIWIVRCKTYLGALISSGAAAGHTRSCASVCGGHHG